MSRARVEKLFSGAVTAHRAGRLDDAIRDYRQVLALQPDHLFAIHYLGVALHQQGRPEAALEYLERSLAIQPRNPGFLSNLGNALKDLGRYEDAERAFRDSLELKPDLVEACFNLAQLRELRGDLDQATAEYERALRLAPGLPAAMERLAVLLSLSDPARCVALARASGAAERAGLGDDREVLFESRIALAALLAHAGDAERAGSAVREALALDVRLPRLASAGGRLVESAMPGLAEVLLAELWRDHPDSVDVAAAFGHVLNVLGRAGEALEVLRPLAAGAPAAPDFWEAYANAFKEFGRLDEAMRANDAVLALADDNLVVRGNQVQLALCRDDLGRPEVLARAREYGAAVERCVPARDIPRPPRAAAGRLRVGVVSADLKLHPVGKFMVNLFRHHDRDHFSLVAFSDSEPADPLAREIRSHAADWCTSAAWSDERLAEAIVSRQIDVLIDLTGHAGPNRLPMFAWRLAPVQATYLGFAGTTGAPGIDCRIADWVTEPAGAEAVSMERLVRMEGSYFCYDACDASGRPPSPAPAVESGVVTFGCFVQRLKITARTLETWRRVLDAVPRARMSVRCRSFGDPGVREDFLRCAQQAGADPSRFDLGPWAPPGEHLVLYEGIDIGLNTFPFHQATTLCDAYWAGVPTLSLVGPAHQSRIALSIGEAAGYPELCFASDDELAEAARQLAADARALSRARLDMRRRVATSALWDGRGFARRFAQALNSMA